MKTLFRALALLPLPLLHALGSAVGWLSFLLSGTYRRRFLANAGQAGYRMSRIDGAVAEAGKLVVETPRLWFGRPVPIAWDGVELIESVRAQGRFGRERVHRYAILPPRVAGGPG